MIVVQPSKPDFKTSNMKIKILQTQSKTRTRKASRGFTLVETVVAMLVGATILSANYLSFAAGFAIVAVTREDLRASQIMIQRMEAIRLASYGQLTNAAKYPPSATQYYDEKGQTNGNGGVAYTVTHQTATALGNLPFSYRSNVTEVTVGVSWKSGTTTRTRSMRSYIARYGVENYVAGNR
jgi:prepilin-type N-terminal cleavage/methylation domain-containing protein